MRQIFTTLPPKMQQQKKKAVEAPLEVGALPFPLKFLQGLAAFEVVKIEKIFNCVIYDKFANEFNRVIRKNPEKKLKDICKHLFHGTRASDPKLLYQGEEGLDIRFAAAGMYGTGSYFANNSHYSTGYAFNAGNGLMQMFVCTVLVGDFVCLPANNQLRIPPLKDVNDPTKGRYDSVCNQGAGHWITYDNSKAYPGYLISYRQRQ